MAINENICSPGSIYFYSEFVKILIGRISGVTSNSVRCWHNGKHGERITLCHDCTNLRVCRRYTSTTVSFDEHNEFLMVFWGSTIRMG